MLGSNYFYNKNINTIYENIKSSLSKSILSEADLPPVNNTVNPFPTNNQAPANLENNDPNANQPKDKEEDTQTTPPSAEIPTQEEEKVDIRREYEEALNELIELFNDSKDNKERTNIKLKRFKGEDDNYKSFMVVYDVPEDKEIYLDGEKYLKGEVDIGLNDIFYNDLQSIAKDVGISKINWKTQDGVNFGTIELKEIDEMEDKYKSNVKISNQ